MRYFIDALSSTQHQTLLEFARILGVSRTAVYAALQHAIPLEVSLSHFPLSFSAEDALLKLQLQLITEHTSLEIWRFFQLTTVAFEEDTYQLNPKSLAFIIYRLMQQMPMLLPVLHDFRNLRHRLFVEDVFSLPDPFGALLVAITFGLSHGQEIQVRQCLSDHLVAENAMIDQLLAFFQIEIPTFNQRGLYITYAYEVAQLLILQLKEVLQRSVTHLEAEC